MSNLVIVESPAKAGTIEKILGKILTFQIFSQYRRSQIKIPKF